MMRKMIILSRSVFFFFFFLSAGILLMEMVMAQNKKISVGVVVDDEFESWVGKMWLSCINMSISDFYASHGHYKTRLDLHTRDSHGDVIGATVAAMDLIRNVEVQAILGPATSMQAKLVTELGEKAQVPIVSFSASSPSLTSIKSTYFFQASQNDKTQSKAIGAIIQRFGWREAVSIYVDNEYGVGIIPYLIEALQEVGTRVPYHCAISPSATDDYILKELYKLMNMQTRVFVVHMFSSLGARLFTKAKEIGMMSQGYVWIMTDGITNSMSSIDPSVVDQSMQGILGIKPYVPKTKQLEYFRVRWKKKFHRDYPDMVDAELNVYGLWAYDATTALAMAIEKAGATNRGINQKGLNASSNLEDLQTVRVSQNGQELIQALSDISFKGLTGVFRFVNQQLVTTDFQIMNINGVVPVGIGFWTPKKGLIKKLNSNCNASSTSNKASLAPILWPGDPTFVPKGWEFPTKGKRLKIGVPVGSFREFVNVTRDSIKNATQVTGYCIQVFDAAIKELPYPVDYDYLPFANPDGSGSGTFDDLVYQVYLGRYDAVVGDTTIIANRSLYVDFTLPYIESEVSMLVRIKDDNNSNAMIFLKPLSPGLWATTCCFFVFIAFVIWVLEHRINNDFRGSPSNQVGTSLWFAFSTMIFAHRERVINNLARVVVIIWSFVLLILTQSYTASLTTLLTVQQLRPDFTDVIELIQKRENVGHFNNSFIFNILIRLGFQESNLKAYSTADECDRLLSLGSENGGISAAFDESPYMKLILARNCSNYTIIKPSTFMSKFSDRNIQQFKTGGFGFVFPRGSPLVADISRAILKVTQNVGMKRIEDAWISQESRCSDSGNSLSSSILGLDSFWGLFLIAGIVSFSALLIYIAMFVYAQKEVLKPSDSETSALSRFLHLLRIFNQRDPKSYTIRSHGGRGVDVSDGEHATNAPSYTARVNLPTDVPPNPSRQTSQEISPC